MFVEIPPIKVKDVHELEGPEGKYYDGNVTVKDIQQLAEVQKIWVDPEIQRGVRGKVTADPYSIESKPPKGAILDQEKINEIAEKLLSNKIFGGSLVWNIRPKEGGSLTFDSETLYIKAKRIYLPDSHHRHRGILKAAQTVTETGIESNVLQRKFPVHIYNMDKEGESDLFFEYNQLTKPAASTRSWYLQAYGSDADLSNKIVRRLVETCPVFANNVETVSNRISTNSAYVVAWGTLRDCIAESYIDLTKETVDDRIAFYKRFFETLATVRQELYPTSVEKRKEIRSKSLVDQAVIFHGYGRLAKDLLGHLLESKGSKDQEQIWIQFAKKLERISPKSNYNYRGWSGDIFDRENPIWKEKGILTPSRSGKYGVKNVRDTREWAYTILSQAIEGKVPS